MAERKAQNEKAESKVQSENTDPKGVETSKVTSEDLAAKAVMPQGDNVTVGGDADKPGEVEVHSVDSEVSPGVTATNDGENPAQTVYVITDKVITDPNSPLAVQIPSAAVNDVTLPIHALAAGTPEQQFASGEATESEGGMLQDKE
jgi:hypothetical protein